MNANIDLPAMQLPAQRRSDILLLFRLSTTDWMISRAEVAQKFTLHSECVELLVENHSIPLTFYSWQPLLYLRLSTLKRCRQSVVNFWKKWTVINDYAKFGIFRELSRVHISTSRRHFATFDLILSRVIVVKTKSTPENCFIIVNVLTFRRQLQMSFPVVNQPCRRISALQDNNTLCYERFT